MCFLHSCLQVPGCGSVGSISICIVFALIQRQQHHSAAEFPAAAKEGVFLERPQGLFCTKTLPSFIQFFFLAFFLFSFFVGRQLRGVLQKGKVT